MGYNFREIDKKWQNYWDEHKTFEAEFDAEKPKFYALVEFPYPSGQGLHVGHPRSYTALDIIARKKRLEGYNVLYPMGWDAFGLPTENYAIKNKIHPKKVTDDNIKNFKRQLKSIGFSFDWSREVNTTDPAYYKWTQWIFLKLFEKGLAYKQEMPINWCTSCKVGLANEEVVGGVCERCGAEVVQRLKSQWMLKITEYSQRLLDDLDSLQYIEKVKLQQRNWIGRSVGAEVDFKLSAAGLSLRVFTTRPDTLFGATYMVMSPEHPYIDKLREHITNWDEVCEYRRGASFKSEIERTGLSKEKTGAPLCGVFAVNPVNGENIPVWISDYVLMSYGTGAIMAVPAHDERDWGFAKKFGLPIIQVVAGDGDVDISERAFTDIDGGHMINSGFIDDMPVNEAIPAIIKYIKERGLGRKKVHFKLRDWVFSRQRYWGEPIPLIWCDKCGWKGVSEDELPLVLPEIDHFEPGEDGESPLAKMDDFVNTVCPECGGPGKRETDTMPQWAGSSWYFIRYADPDNDGCLASKEAIDYWLPVDWYNGGMEHTTLHLLYSRFWYKFLYDIGVVGTDEPYLKRTSHGMILGENNEKMSKSRGNVINPDDMVFQYGADTFRTYEMFIGAFDQATPWSMQGIRGCHKFMERVWNLKDMVVPGDSYSEALETLMHKTIKRVGEDIERMKFNTAIAAMMSLVNEFYRAGRATKAEFGTLLRLLNPFAPHMTEELWQTEGFGGTIAGGRWPEYDDDKTIDEMVEIAVQINGKIRCRIMMATGLDRGEAEEAALSNAEVISLLQGREVSKVFAVVGKLVNIIVKP